MMGFGRAIDTGMSKSNLEKKGMKTHQREGKGCQQIEEI